MTAGATSAPSATGAAGEDERPASNPADWRRLPLLSLNGVLLFTNIILLVRPVEQLLKDPASIPPGLATLTGALIAGLFVAWQTKRGFRNLLASQEHRARIEKEARAEQARIDEQKEQRTLDRERKMLASGLHAELIGLANAVSERQKTYAMLAQYHSHPAAPRHGKLLAWHFRAPFFEANIAKIGSLGAAIAADVIIVLSRTNTDPLDPEKLPESSTDTLAAIYEQAALGLSEWISDMVHVSARLASLQGPGLQDPGSLWDDQAKRRASAR